MYGIGQLPSYGFFVAHGSVVGIAFTLANQLCCYAFYHFYERPHIASLTRPGAQAALIPPFTDGPKSGGLEGCG